MDEAVILAIVGDYDLAHDFDGAREVLMSLSKDVPVEEQSGFNHSGIAYDALASDLVEQPQAADSATETTESSRRHADDSSRTDFSEPLSEQFERLDLSRDIDVSKLDHDEKVAELMVMFPILKAVDISYALKKAEDDFDKAFEELLNTQYLEENGLRPRGIDGAFRPDDEIVYRKARNASELKTKAGKTKLDVGYRLKPSEILITDISTSTSTTASSTATSPALKGIDSSSNRKTYRDLERVSSAARETSNQSFVAAQRAYRRGKSDALYRPVAAVYAERGREQAARARAAESDTYDALVDEQSSNAHIDLHGVPVADGVRIALERTQLWWGSLGEDRAKRAREGFTVITGLGTHSATGVSRLRQEVGAALKREGWRVRTETGQFIVTGKQ